MADDRPNPDQLLADVEKQEIRQKRGRLKVFFGMAAGVGKTYAMLEEARKRAAEGLDVLIGYAEPHIRTDTESLLLGMELLPYKLVQYRNATLKEFDLDAALARKPELVCVDELAHTNAPGMRHEKRWQDVVELLAAGINVYTTLNVQHQESVNDIVERITGVQVRETLPDSVLEQADEVELVDIAPEELLERFREGKVYRPEQAERAAKHFFTKGNLIALRELALRTTAQRVDAQMLEARREAGAKHAWPANERVLVCVGPSPMSRRLVRSARRLAAGLRADWIAAYVETSKDLRLSAEDRRRVEGTLKLAEELGSKTITLTGHNVADEIIAYAQRQNVTKIVIGKPQRPRWRELLFGSVVDELVRRSGDIDIHVIRGETTDRDSGTVTAPRTSTHDVPGYIAAFAVTLIAILIGWPLYHGLHWPDANRPPHFSNINVLMIFLLGVLWVATHHTRAAAIVCSILAVAAFDFMFVVPYLTFTVSDQQYLLTFGVMLVTALTISTLTHRVRRQAEAARQRERRTAALLALSRELAAARTTDEITSSTVRHVRDVLGQRAVLLLPDADRHLTSRGDSGGTNGAITSKELGVAQWAYEHDQIAGRGTNTLPAADGTYVPLASSRGVVGVLGLLDSSGSAWLSEQRQLAEAFASQTALALERATLAEEARAAWERVEAEFLRNTLLSGVSHELRTPLAGITGAATALIETESRLPEQGRKELLETLVSEAERMERLINNLLDMTRLEAGGLSLRREWQPIHEVIGSALHHLERRLKDREVKLDIPATLPMVHTDTAAMEQVVANLLDNALEYTPPNSPIEISARADEHEVFVEIADRGPGLPPGTERRVFEKFFRAAPGAGRRGIGLGLAISRGIVEAHEGRIFAANRAGGGAVFTFTLPVSTPPTVLAPEDR
jgi:two-component system sensor histidine kinase KdpD